MGDLIQQREHEIIKLHEALQEAFKKSAMAVFVIGRYLTEVKDQLDHGQFLPWIEQRMPFAYRTAAKYMRVYDHVKDVDEKHIAQLATTEAYVDAGIRKMIAANPKEPEEAPRVSALAAFSAMRIKNGRQVSELKLTTTRLAWNHLKELYIEREGIGMGRALSVWTEPHHDLDPAVFQELRDNLQLSYEIYYHKVEEAERSGAISKPTVTDIRQLIKHRRGRDHIPSVPPDYLKRAGRKPAGGKK